MPQNVCYQLHSHKSIDSIMMFDFIKVFRSNKLCGFRWFFLRLAFSQSQFISIQKHTKTHTQSMHFISRYSFRELSQPIQLRQNQKERKNGNHFSLRPQNFRSTSTQKYNAKLAGLPAKNRMCKYPGFGFSRTILSRIWNSNANWNEMNR